MAEHLILTSRSSSITFDDMPFVLEKLELSSAAIQRCKNGASKASSRDVTITGYILSEGETDSERRGYLAEKRDHLCRAADPVGSFTLMRSGRAIDCRAISSPRFSADAGFGGADADRFEIRAVSDPGLFYAVGNDATELKHVFGGDVESSALSGSISVTNHGDVACGAVIEIVSGDTPPSGIVLSLPDEGTVSFVGAIPSGNTAELDTRDGKKSVKLISGGISRVDFGIIDWQSTMLAFPPGTSILSWRADGGSISSLRVTLTPLYFAS